MPPRDSTATPRNTRARQRTPLPAVPSAPSFAYGAPGKAELRTQLRTAGRDFGEGFEAARQASVGPSSVAEAEDAFEDEEEDEVFSLPREEMERSARRRRTPSVPAERRVTRQTPQPQPQPQPIIELQPARASAERTITDLDAAARYEPANRGERVEMRANRDEGVEMRVHRHEVEEFPEPNRVLVFRRAFPRYIRALFTPANTGIKAHIWFWLLRLFALIGFLLIFSPVLPEPYHSERNEVIYALKRFFGVGPFSTPPNFLQESWNHYQHDTIFSKALPDYNMPDLQYGININFLRRIEKLEARMTGLEDSMSLQQETMTAVQEMLPSNVVVQVVDGRYEIPEVFWAALQERLATDNDMAPLWQAFIAESEGQIEEMFSQTADTKLQQAMEQKHVITAPQFTQLMNDKYEALSNQFMDHIRKVQRSHFEDVKDIAAGAASEVVKQYPSPKFIKDQLEQLTMMNELLNNYRTTQEVNWFSIGLGARIDPLHTSPTAEPETKGWIQGLLRSITPVQLSSHPPITALKRWDEATDCWCANVDKEGRSKISVIIPEMIYPTRLDIEHMPFYGTLDIQAAPRDFELWAKLDDINNVKEVANAIEQSDARLSCSHSPGPEYVCIASNRYDIHEMNWVQSFALPRMEDYTVRSNKFVVRLVNNWGANYTCLYRLRMTGDKV